MTGYNQSFDKNNYCEVLSNAVRRNCEHRILIPKSKFEKTQQIVKNSAIF